VKYAGTNTVVPRNGSWNMQDVRFHTGSTIKKWTFLWIRTHRGQQIRNMGEVQTHVQNFAKFMNQSGIQIGVPTVPSVELELRDGDEAYNEERISNQFRTYHNLKDAKPDFVFIILPYNDAGMYKKIKTLGDTKAGIHTICVVGSKFSKPNRQEQYFANVALKFNLKAGGINQVLDPAKLGIISEGKTMVVGIDVTHPSPGSKENAPSVAGMVASVDRFLGQWPASLRIQESRKEMVSELDSMLKSRLELWQLKNKGQLPQNILIYRDGVSEGQYQTVLDVELPLLRKACASVYPAPITKSGGPAITIVIVGKRHHTRFYPSQPTDADRSENCKNGTVVDRGVTEVRNWDFFLQAHACLQGTARPAHYYVVLDEIFRDKKNKPKNLMHKNAADVLEDLTHNMCHLFGRATKAVSICPPAYYADLLCERARCYLGRIFEPESANVTAAASVVSGASAGDARAEDVVVAPGLRNSMFYI
jgi:eukaryotic translation initiation factor 2C